MLTSRLVFLCLEVRGVRCPFDADPLSKPHLWVWWTLLSLSLFVFFQSFASQHDSLPRHHQGFKPHKIISWQLSTNLVTQFYWHPGHPHLEPKAHRGHKNPRDAMPKVPAISDVTHAAPHSHHGDNPVMINTNLPASAQGVKVLWRRGNRGKGLGKADTLSAGGATVISGSEIRR